MDEERLAEHVRIAATVLEMNAMLCFKTDLFGRKKPTEKQIAWTFGFCDCYAQDVGLRDDVDFMVFMAPVFELTFGKSGAKNFTFMLKNQDRLQEQIINGGNACFKWLKDGTPPAMPSAD